MKTLITIFVACATVVQVSSVQLSAVSSQDQHEDISDFAAVNAYRDTAAVHAKKAALNIFSTQFISQLTKDGLTDNSFTTKVCKEVINTPQLAVLESILDAILIVSPADSSAAATRIRNSGATIVTDLSEGFCSALILLLGKNPSTNKARIQSLQTKQITLATKLSAYIFSTMKNGWDTRPQIQSAFEYAEIKANTEFISLMNETFVAIADLNRPYASGATKDDISSLVETTQTGMFSKYKAVFDIVFELLQTLLTASHVIQSGVTLESSTIEAIRTSTFSDFSTVLECNLEVSKKDGVDGTDESVDETCDFHSSLERATSHSQKGVATIFDTILKEVARAPLRNQIASGNVACDFVSGREEVVAAFTSAIHATFEAAVYINNEDSSVLESAQDEVVATMTRLVEYVYNANGLIRNENSSIIFNEYQPMQDAARSTASALIHDLYYGVLGGRTISASLKSSWDYSIQDSTYLGDNTCDAIFSGIKIKMTEIFSDNRYGIAGNTLSSNVAKTDAVYSLKSIVGNIFSIIEYFVKNSGASSSEINEVLTTVRYHGVTAMTEFQNGVELIFDHIMSECSEVSEVSSTNLNLHKTDSSIEAGRAQASAAFMAALESIFCIFPKTDSASFSTIENSAISALKTSLDDIHKAIKLTQGNELSDEEIAEEFKALELVSTQNFVQQIMYVSEIMRTGSNSDAELEAKIDSDVRQTVVYFSDAAAAIFKAIRDLNDVACSGSQTSANSLSSITGYYDDASQNMWYAVQSFFQSVEELALFSTEKRAPVNSCHMQYD